MIFKPQLQPLPICGIWKSFRLFNLALVSTFAISLSIAEATPPNAPGRSARGISYRHDEIPEGPWSIHIVKVPRTNHDLEFHTAMAGGPRFGLGTLSEQMKHLPPELGKPLAGLNGDFYKKRNPYIGDPKGLQVIRGELVSAPCDWSCVWFDPDGNPHMTNVTSRLHVVWPNGAQTPFGLNEERARDGAVLYTGVVGSTTQTSGGRELILEQNGTNVWLPLKPGATYSARVREVRETGSSPIAKNTMVLSLGPQLRVPPVAKGSVIQISTATFPDLAGVQTGIGGGPAMVRDGKVIDRSDPRVRHPRAAIGWNKEDVFLVEVDGRQRNLSVGMTIGELADYMVKIGCTEAMNLDGGGSATCWVYGQVMNSPSQGEEREMGNSIIVIQRERN